MPEHAHLLLWPHEGVKISSILYQIKKPVTNRALGWIRKNSPSFLPRMLDRQPNGDEHYRVWQRGGGHDRNLRSIADVHEKIGYIHQNPVRRGLIEKPGDWPWSSWRAWHLGVDEPIRIDRGTLPLLKKR